MTDSKTKTSWNLEFWAFQIVKSVVDCINLKQIDCRKLLNVLLKHFSLINGPQNGKNYSNISPYDFSYDLSYSFLFGQLEFSRFTHKSSEFWGNLWADSGSALPRSHHKKISKKNEESMGASLKHIIFHI